MLGLASLERFMLTLSLFSVLADFQIFLNNLFLERLSGSSEFLTLASVERLRPLILPWTCLNIACVTFIFMTTLAILGSILADSLILFHSLFLERHGCSSEFLALAPIERLGSLVLSRTRLNITSLAFTTLRAIVCFDVMSYSHLFDTLHNLLLL